MNLLSSFNLVCSSTLINTGLPQKILRSSGSELNWQANQSNPGYIQHQPWLSPRQVSYSILLKHHLCLVWWPASPFERNLRNPSTLNCWQPCGLTHFQANSTFGYFWLFPNLCTKNLYIKCIFSSWFTLNGSISISCFPLLPLLTFIGVASGC